jgi:hypothetical protein
MAVGGPKIVALKRTRGDTVPFRVRLRNKQKVAIDVTGYTAKLTVSTSEAPADVTGQQAQYIGTPVVPYTDGVIEFAFPLVDVNLVGEFFYDLQVTDAGGKLSTVMRGAFTFEQDITKT